MIELRLQKTSDPNSFAFLYQLGAFVHEEKPFAKFLTFTDVGNRADLVKGLRDLADAIEQEPK